MRRLLGVALATVLTSATSYVVSAGPAFANEVHCGDVITQDTKLDSDLIGCPGDGVVIGADDITLDLNGHTIEGNGFASLGACTAGVADGKPSPFVGCPPESEGHAGVTIKDGVVAGFVFGVSFNAASRSTVRGIAISRTFDAITLQGGSAGNVITENRLSGSRISLQEAGGDNRVEGNSVLGNKSERETAPAIYITGSGNGNEIAQNLLSADGVGVFLSDSFGATLIENNSVLHNDVGIWLIESQHTRIENNRVLGSNGGGPDSFSALGDGIHVDDAHNELVGNVTSRNRDDGIEVALNPDNTVARNTANRNGDLGIEAVPGVVDGGRNKAMHKGNPLECLNIVCKTNGRP